MLKQIFLFLFLFSLVITSVPAQSRLDYPKPRKAAQVDDFHGTKVSDPYRWMEDAPLNDDTKAWIEAENNLTNS